MGYFIVSLQVNNEGVKMAKRKEKKRLKRAILLLIGAMGIIVFWRGVWTLADTTPVIKDPFVSVTIGVILLLISHQWYREL